MLFRSFDAKTGKEAWRHRTIPKPGEPGNESWGNIPLREASDVFVVVMWLRPPERSFSVSPSVAATSS